MTNKCFAYIHLNRQKGVATTSGIAFKEFIEGLERKPANLLFLDNYCPCWDIPRHTALGLEHVRLEEFDRYVPTVDANFFWVDFQNEADLDRVTKQELAELLYFGHKVEPFNQFQIANLRNRFAYYSHDDDWFVRIYMENPDDYRAVVAYKLVKELKGRKRTMPPPPDEIIDRLMGMFEQGAVIDFENANIMEGEAGVFIYPIGEHQDMDDIHNRFDRQRAAYAGEHLVYQTRGKRWRFY